MLKPCRASVRAQPARKAPRVDNRTLPTRSGICRADKPFVLTADTCRRRAHGISIYHVAPKSLGGYEFVGRRRYGHVLARTDNGR